MGRFARRERAITWIYFRNDPIAFSQNLGECSYFFSMENYQILVIVYQTSMYTRPVLYDKRKGEFISI